MLLWFVLNQTELFLLFKLSVVLSLYHVCLSAICFTSSITTTTLTPGGPFAYSLLYWSWITLYDADVRNI